MIRYQKDIKYQVYEDTEYELQSDIIITKNFTHRFYGVNKDSRTIWVKAGFAWDGATMFPDFNWIFEGALWHDVLHLLISKGAIPTSENNKIDNELALAVKKFGRPTDSGWLSRTMLKFRGSYVKRFTGFVHQSVTQARPVYEINQGRIWRIK